ncbi:hypothetical protein EYF80_012482 [Liparis tanakae]|uniref:Uncharacterized protein n=1 Tax=Liparis tanakae TaxID=230148 RepID=A0A4Z2IHQ0_9TELE|nr:hypothetical protein EYF80_012482 [Liparis tanakae]
MTPLLTVTFTGFYGTLMKSRDVNPAGTVPSLASAAGWLTISQLRSLIGNQSGADASGIKGAELEENGKPSGATAEKTKPKDAQTLFLQHHQFSTFSDS